MFRDILSSRAILIGFVFFVLMVAGSLLYSWHVRRTTEVELGPTNRALQALENRNKTHTAQEVNVPIEAKTPGLADMPEVNMDTHKSTETDVLPTDTETLNLTDAFLPDDFVSEEAPTEDVPVSPFGFGPYPEVPAGYPHGVSWINPPEKLLRPERSEHRKRLELIDRVMVKAWISGNHDFTSGIYENEKVYLLYSDTVYVEYGKLQQNPDGTFTTPIASTLSGSAIKLTEHQIRNGIIPDRYHVIELEETGYNPYEYLNLP